MASKFEEDMDRELQRQQDAKRKQQEFDAARAAVRQGLIDKIIGAAHEFRDTMVAHNIPPQPLHAHVGYSDAYANRKDRRKLLGTRWGEDFDTRHKGWQSLHMVYSPADFSGNTAFSGGWHLTGPFVTTDGLVLDAGGGFIEAPSTEAPPPMPGMMTKPAVLNLSPHEAGSYTRQKKFDGPPEWAIRKQPAPLVEAQQAYLDAHVERFDPTYLRSNTGYQSDQQAARYIDAHRGQAEELADSVRAQLVGSALVWLQYSPKQT
jgi:hypothetical protein